MICKVMANSYCTYVYTYIPASFHSVASCLAVKQVAIWNSTVDSPLFIRAVLYCIDQILPLRWYSGGRSKGFHTSGTQGQYTEALGQSHSQTILQHEGVCSSQSSSWEQSRWQSPLSQNELPHLLQLRRYIHTELYINSTVAVFLSPNWQVLTFQEL